ncbi:hypothetical protein MSAR_01390 [Mycolicibacterium sarraceniae]|uniref:Isochorismatase-like domain-containing protein n=1 Tax=Mycolicibacterium sarraceniae TaxID=1534348 RepID=A0A7I7SJS0_9MYCO|nr:isochorismatase family protein [Mycolicibacterium sarraceniae]BBY57003.1 hypothetical protein MSAR_01390 [Mycolicibacterium sarraceniae]
MTFDPKTTAVVLIEYQNDFTTDGGVLHGAVSEVMAKTDLLTHTRDVLTAARTAGAAVMHAPITFAEGYGEITNHPYRGQVWSGRLRQHQPGLHPAQ